MLDDSRTSHWPLRPAPLWGLAFTAFDAATIVPTLAALYIIKRAVHFDTFKGTDMLPDDLIEGALAWVAHLAAGWL